MTEYCTILAERYKENKGTFVDLNQVFIVQGTTSPHSMSNYVLEQHSFLFLTGIHDSSERVESNSIISHILEAPVLSWSHVHHPASVLGLLVRQPVSVHHVARLAVGHAVTILDVVTVLHHLIGLTTEVLPLVDLHLVLALVLCF